MAYKRDFQYESLAGGIVIQAGRDYRKALRRLKKEPNDSEALQTKNECEEFFRSKYFSILTDLDPEMVLRRLAEV